MITHTAGSAKFLQALAVVLHRRLISLEPILAKCDFLFGPGLGIDHLEIAIAGRLEFLRGENLHGENLRPAIGQ